MSQIKKKQHDRKARVSKTDWLNAGLDVLKESGIEAVRIERLAGRLGVAKSGFYYHFRDREDLRQKLLDYWLALDGSPLLRERMLRAASPQERLRIVADVVNDSELSQLDSAVRQWAQTDLKVRRVWRKEVNKRLEHIRGIFSQLGFEGDELEMRVRTFVAYYSSEGTMFSDLSTKDREALRDLRIALLTVRS